MFGLGRARKSLEDVAHLEAMEAAKAAYLGCNGEVQISSGVGDGFSIVSAAGPGRVGWDTYFDVMTGHGYVADYDRYKRAEKRGKWDRE